MFLTKQGNFFMTIINMSFRGAEQREICRYYRVLQISYPEKSRFEMTHQSTDNSYESLIRRIK
jgi:hypothetical protein